MAIKTTDTEKMTDLYLSNIATAIEKIDAIKEVIKTFDNKVYNARVVNKLEEVINAGLDVSKRYSFKFEFDEGSMRLTMNFYNHRSFAGERYFQYLPDGMEKIEIIPYTPSEYNRYYLTDERNSKYYKRQEDAYFYIDGDHLRINADFICKRLEEGRGYLIDKKVRLEADRNRLEEYETKRQKLIEELKELQNGMAWEYKSIYHLKDINTFAL